MALSVAACGSSRPTNGAAEGDDLAEAFAADLAQREFFREPYRCARASELAAQSPMAGGRFDAQTGTLALALGDKGQLRIAVVADARGDDVETLAAARKLHDTLVTAKADLILSLGGLAENQEGIGALLAALIGTSDLPLIALPGDREDVGAHRAALAKLAEAGARVVDGSLIRRIRIGEVLIATMPGIAREANLVAKAEGCQHLDSDVGALQESLRDQEGFVLLASYAPARGASDEGLGGIAVGEPELSPLVDAESVDLMVHGMVDVSLQEGQEAGRGKLPRSLPARSLDPLDGGSLVLFLRISGKQLTWEHLRVH